ncbi:MAG: SEC-C domain-containing protein [Actinobacteria bacterium]|nr:SEC-C domain-containing protein [Actinomycetota bacterium]
MHLDVVVQPQARPAVHNVQYSAPEDPVQGSGAIRPAVAAGNGQTDVAADGNGSRPQEEPVPVTVVKSAEQKLGRNQPCHCGSGKKFKLCHGK